jgi:UDP-glucose 4-epimerase/UDP-glucuronate decarboxylase
MENVARLMMDEIGEQCEILECGGRSGSVSRRCPDTSKLQRLTGFKAKIDLKEGLSHTCAWYLAHPR